MLKHVVILIQPVGTVEKLAVDYLVRRIPEVVDGSVCSVSSTPIQIVGEAFNPLRGQYDSSILFRTLVAAGDVVTQQIIFGICGVDLYTSGLNFVFGQAECPGHVAIISTHRLKPQFYGLPDDDRLFLERVLKEAVHEVGHCLGLRHCRRSSCVMFFSNSLGDTDRKGSSMCGGCAKRLRQPT